MGQIANAGPGYVGGLGTTTGTILVLYILLVIVACACMI